MRMILATLLCAILSLSTPFPGSSYQGPPVRRSEGHTGPLRGIHG